MRAARRYARFGWIGLLAALLPACGSDSDEVAETLTVYDDGSGSAVPSRYGLYAIQDGRLGRLDGERSFQVETWESRSDLLPAVEFIVFDRALDDRALRLENAITLRRLAHVRNDVAATGAAVPMAKDVWVVADLPDFAVPLDFAPLAGRPDMVRAMPARPLEPGLYALEFRSGESVASGRFGVSWSDVDKDAYVAANCVDRYAGQAVKYRPCSLQQLGSEVSPGKMSPQAGQVQDSSAGPLELRQVQAVKATDQGAPILTVQGVVVNVSNVAQPVPRLMATVKDVQGAELDRWTFAAEAAQLPPGGSTGFRTETVYPTTESANVAVTFAPPGTGS
jgi:hypothetical protein